MATSTRAIPNTAAEFLDWEDRQRLRYELVGGVVRAMIGGTVGHNLLATRVLVALDNQLREDCTTHQSDLKVVADRDGDLSRRHVRYGALNEDATEAYDPVLILEILSPSTRREDPDPQAPRLPGHPAPALAALCRAEEGAGRGGHARGRRQLAVGVRDRPGGDAPTGGVGRQLSCASPLRPRQSANGLRSH